MDEPTNCTKCNRKFRRDAIHMGSGIVWCPRCYIIFRIWEADCIGIKVDEKTQIECFEGREHIDDVLASKGMARYHETRN